MVFDLWADEKHDRVEHQPVPIDSEDLAIVSYVVVRYGEVSMTELIRMTHAEAPWRDVSEQDDEALFGGSDVIHQDRIKAFFSSMEDVQHLTTLARANVDAVRPRVRPTHRPVEDDPIEIRRRLDAAKR